MLAVCDAGHRSPNVALVLGAKVRTKWNKSKRRKEEKIVGVDNVLSGDVILIIIVIMMRSKFQFRSDSSCWKPTVESMHSTCVWVIDCNCLH